MEKYIQLPGGGMAFITGCQDDSGCEHQWDGEGLITFWNGETFKESEYRKILDGLTTEQQVNDWHEGKGSTMGECTCSKCGIAYTQVHNPYYL
jgi:hypothetical protein